MSEELKPCPFCGGAAEAGEIQESIHDKGPQFYYVSCSLCGAETCESDTKSGAYSHWNTRAELAALKAGRGEAVAYPRSTVLKDCNVRYSASTAPPATGVNVPSELLELLRLAWKHMPSPEYPDLDPQHVDELVVWHMQASALLAQAQEVKS